MPNQKKRINLSDIRALPKNSVIWDTAVVGFHARRQRSDAVSYVVTYRTREGRQRWHSIGRHGSPWTVDLARIEARRILGDVASGRDAAQEKYERRTAATVADLVRDYFQTVDEGRIQTRGKIGKKPSTIAVNKIVANAHILPLLGQRKLTSITSNTIEGFLHDVADGKTAKLSPKRRATGGKTTASKSVQLLGAMFVYGIKRGLCSTNPVKGVLTFPDGQKDRRCSPQEYAMLGRALEAGKESSMWPCALAGIKFLTLTGFRRGEMLNLKWRDCNLDGRIITLEDSKTGKSVRVISSAARHILAELRNAVTGDVYCFPGERKRDTIMKGFVNIAPRIFKLSNMPADITCHTLRHSFASVCAEIGYGELVIAALLGHSRGSITQRYVHHADKFLLEVSDRVGEKIEAMMRGERIDDYKLTQFCTGDNSL
jgi:integrase